MENNRNDHELVFNITYHPNISNLKDMTRIQILLTSDQDHQKVFPKVPIISFQKTKSLKGILVGAKVPPLKKNEGFLDNEKNRGVRSVSTLLVLINT